MTPAFEKLQKHLKQLPGLGYRSSERIALHLLVEKPAELAALVTALEEAARAVRRCVRCGNLAETDHCAVCVDVRRDRSVVCVVEHVPDLVAIERSGAYRGSYHVLHGKLSPIDGVGPDELNLASLRADLPYPGFDPVAFEATERRGHLRIVENPRNVWIIEPEQRKARRSRCGDAEILDGRNDLLADGNLKIWLNRQMRPVLIWHRQDRLS